ncbi:uncharacterized protein LOC143078298 [Mytilus galloprovincialis]|uniref:uncharacterized protein LOC143078298 n=1 Tax=Mytilus galloprovincialis TaxID=29158 RepID=UPI003F7CC7BD
MDSSETTINIVSSIQTTDDTSPESTFPEISQELVTIKVSAVNTEVSAIPPEVSAITTEMLAVTPDVSTVTIGVSAVTTEASTVTTEASAITTEASTETTKISAVTTEVSAVTTEASAITTEVSPVTTDVSAETTTNEMYLEVTTMVTQTGDVTRGAIITQSTMYAQNTSTRCVCPCLQDKSELELTNYVNMLIDQIKIDVKETVIAKNRRTSAPDNRRSAKAIGFVGIIVIVLPVLFFVVFDVVTFIKFHSGK